MFGKEIKTLAERKRLLLAQAVVHRSVIDLECATLRARVHATQQSIRSGGPWILAGSALAGLLVSGRRRGFRGLIKTAMTAWWWIRRFKKKE